MDNSGHSDSACSDDTEYLLGQNVSIREIDDVDIPSHDEVPSSLGRSHRTSPHHSPQRLHHAKSTKSRSPQRKEVHARGKPMPQKSPEKLVGRGGSKRSPVVEKRRDISKAHRVMPQDGYGNERGQYYQNVENITRSKKSGRESKAEQFPEQRGIDSRRSPQFKPTGTSKTKSVSHKDSSHGTMSSRHTPPTRNDIVVDRQQKKQSKKPMRHVAPVNQENWEIESELSEDMVNGGYSVTHIETSELESEMSEATEDLIGGEDQENDDITEKLKELNLAVNYDTSTNEYFDDKVREGAELLSKLFGGNVDNYYSSSRVELTMATNTTNQNRWKRQPLRILRLSGQSKSSASGSGSVQEVSRSNGQIEERRNLSDSSNSTTHQSLTRSVTPQPRARVAEHTNTTVTDQSSSFESSVSTSGKRQGSATRKEVRFRDDVRASRDDVTASRNDVTTSRDRQWRDHQQLATDGEFIRETSAFRAAMDYEDDDEDDDNNSQSREQSESFRSEVDGRHIEQYNRRAALANNGDGRKALHEPERNVRLRSPSKHSSNENRDNTMIRQNQMGVSRSLNYDVTEWECAPAPGSNHHFDGSYALSPHKDRGEQRFHVEKVSDSSHSKRLDRQEEGAVTGGFMTSTPHTKAQAVFSPPQSYQTDSPKEVQRMAQKLQETERKLNRSSQELKDVEIDIEDAMSRKKFAVQEIHVLEETVKRNKAEVQSSENLVEQYRQQATKTRSQLMELELQRDNLQHEIKELRSSLTRQKQESRHAMDVEKTNGLKVLELSIEKDQLHSEVESLQAQLQQVEGSLTHEKHSYLEKIGLLQDQLHEEQRVSKESVEKVKQQLEDERQKARDSHYERINAIHKLQDDSKEMHEKELEVLKNRLVREKEMELESLREKTKRECEVSNRKLQERDQKIIQLESNIKEHEEDITKLKAQVFQEQQKLFECESEWKENMARQDTHTKGFQLEVDSLKQKETSLLDKQRRTEELLEEKMLELRRHGEKASSYSDELNQIIKNKDEEITMLRGLVRQQEDATRLLGEKMRNEAQEHIRNALEKERESTDLERARHQAKLEEIRDKYESALKQVREELEAERLGHNHLNTSVNKIKKEVEKLRELNLQTEQERVNAVAQVRNEAKEEVGKMKDKIRELSSLAERSEKETVMEITEECRKTAALLGDSANTTPVRNLSGSYLSDSPRSAMDSPAKDALLNLRSYNEELRQHLTEARKELELNNRELALKKQQVNNGDLTIQQVSLFKKALKAKEDEVERFKRQLQEENERLKLERTTYQKTIDRLEKELKQAKAATPNSSPMVNGNSPPESGVGTSLSSATPSPRPGEDSSSARLLRHLQGRVQQLRAQNDSLRKSSENESLNESHCSVMSTESVNGADDDTKRLHSALKMTEDKAQRNAAMLSQKMMEMTKLQKMLTHATKENMKLERAYASLQRKIIDSSR